MITAERRKRIAEWVESEGTVGSEQLETHFKVSTMTIWRDLKALEEQGVIRRVHGGAVRLNESERVEARFTTKRRIRSREKDAIARYALRHFVQPNQILVLEAGTTVANLAELIEEPGLTILTNGLDILNITTALPCQPTIHSCGGILREHARTFVGPQAEAFFKDFHADIFFMSATAYSPECGLTDPSPLEIEVKRAMARSASRRILLMDSSKLGARSLQPIFKLDKVDVLITDRGAPPEVLGDFRAAGVDVRLAP